MARQGACVALSSRMSRPAGRPAPAAGVPAGRVGSAFAAELGTMAVTEQTDSLRMLGSDPVDYLVSPRVIACMIALPILNLMCFTMGALSLDPWLLGWRIIRLEPAPRSGPIACAAAGGGFFLTGRSGYAFIRLRARMCAGMAASAVLADVVYNVPPSVIIDSCVRALTAWDITTSIIKAWVFGVIISVVRHALCRHLGASLEPCLLHACTGACVLRSLSPGLLSTPATAHWHPLWQVSCSWGFTTGGGAKGVGESTTSAVVISLVLIFVADFGLSFLFFQGQGDALKQLT